MATTATGGVQVTNGAIQISGSDGSAITAAVATIDPVTGHRRFNGWVRSDSGPIFGITEQGKLEWVAPDDMQSLNEIDWGKVQTIPDDALTSVPLTQPHAGWLLWNFRGGGQIYVVGDDGQLHYIPDWHTFEVQFQWKNVLPVSAGQVKQIPVGPSVPSAP